MSQHSDQGAGAGAGASRPAADNGSAITVGSIVTAASIFVLFLIFAFGIASLNYCISLCDRRLRDVPASPSGSRRSRRRGGAAVGDGDTRTRGVDPELLRSLPVTVYRAAAKGSSAVECAVCLTELEDGEAARFLPRCGHGFHAKCVDKWLASRTTCPLCRLTVAKPDVTPPPPALAPVRPEPANYYTSVNLPATMLLGVSDRHRGGAVTAAAPSTERVATATLVIEIPESDEPTTCDAANSPGSARLRSIRRFWSFGRQGVGASCSSCSCAGGSDRADVVEKGAV